MSSGTSAPPQGPGSGGNGHPQRGHLPGERQVASGGGSAGESDRSGRPHSLEFLREFLGTLPGLITAIATLITAIAAALYGGTRLADAASASAPQPTVTVTVTAAAQPQSTASAPATASSAAADTPSTTGAGIAPVSGKDLSSLTPVQSGVDNFTTGTERIGATSYSDGIRFSCTASGSAFGYAAPTYVVAGYKTLYATFGVPDDAVNAVGNSATIKFLKDGTSTELGQPITVALDSPQRVILHLQGTSQLQISCTAANADDPNGGGADIDVAIGDATLSPS